MRRWWAIENDGSPQPNVLGSGSFRVLSLQFWAMAIATGVGAGLGGGLLMRLLRAVQHAAWPYRAGDNFLAAVQHASPTRILLVVTGAGCVAGISRFILRQGILHQGSGHGGELAQKIWFSNGRLSPFPTVLRAVTSIVIVGLGASLGREAAPKQIGALAASVLAQWASLPNSQRRLLSACGAGAGIAAVYNVPFGGAIFALEVLLGTISLPLVPPALATAVVATAVSWLLLPNEPTYQIPFYPVSSSQMVWSAVAGPIIGMVAVFYVRLISMADVMKSGRLFSLVAPLTVFAALGATAIAFPHLLGNGKDVVQMMFAGQPGLALVLAILVLKPLATAACLASGAPGGLFTPTFTLGALLGGALGQIWLFGWPGAPPGSFAIIGACALLAAATQGPVSAVVLTLELTRRLDTLMVPVILATAGAVGVARMIESRSLYSARIHLGRAAVARLPGTVSTAAKLSELQRSLLDTGRRSVSVVDESGTPVGEVTRDCAVRPSPNALPLETATAADFVTAGETGTMPIPLPARSRRTAPRKSR
ncbi:MAG: chloride channel protein [Bradyrhizobium sp.]|nr:chloride channel protein [Bradyrhizobium sp.]